MGKNTEIVDAEVVPEQTPEEAQEIYKERYLQFQEEVKKNPDSLLKFNFLDIINDDDGYMESVKIEFLSTLSLLHPNVAMEILSLMFSLIIEGLCKEYSKEVQVMFSADVLFGALGKLDLDNDLLQDYIKQISEITKPPETDDQEESGI